MSVNSLNFRRNNVFGYGSGAQRWLPRSINFLGLRRNSVAGEGGEPLGDGPIQLSQGAERRLSRRSQIMRVMSGSAWITVDGQDIILTPHDTLLLKPGRHDAVISALGRDPLTYEVGA